MRGHSGWAELASIVLYKRGELGYMTAGCDIGHAKLLLGSAVTLHSPVLFSDRFFIIDFDH